MQTDWLNVSVLSTIFGNPLLLLFPSTQGAVTRFNYYGFLVLRMGSTNSKIFVQFLNMQEKADLKKGYRNSKRKLGVNANFSKIINQQYL